MNEEGKSFFSCYRTIIFLLFVGFSFVPYSDLLEQENLQRLLNADDMVENLIVFMYCAAFFFSLMLISYIAAGIVSLLVHLFFRLRFLYKLRNPIRIYTGDLSNSHLDNRMNKINKMITSIKDFFHSKLWEDISFYLLCAFCAFILLCMTYAE